MSPAHLEKAIDAALASGDTGTAETLAQEYLGMVGQPTPDGDPARAPWFRARYIAAQVALAAGQLRLVLDRLAPLLPNTSKLSEELAGRLHSIAAEALARLGRQPEARSHLQHIAPLLLERLPLLQLRALRIRLWLGEVHQLTNELADCGRSLEATGDQANLALLVCEEGYAWDRAGDLTRAGDCWRRAEQLCPASSTGYIRADVLLQLGRLDHLRGHLAAALSRYDDALACVGRGPQRQELELRRLLVRFDLRQGDRARTSCPWLFQEQTLEQLPEELRPLAEMVRGLIEEVAPSNASDEMLAFQAAQRGDVAAARALYANALAGTPSPERRARLVMALGLLALNHQDATEARSWLRQAEELARSCDLPEVLVRTLQVGGQLAAEKDGDDELARRLFEEALLITEVQAGQFTNAVDRGRYRGQRASVLRQLLRSACRRGDAAAVFSYQECERGRLLLELLHAAPTARKLSTVHTTELPALQGRIELCERELGSARVGSERRRELLRLHETLLLERDRLFEDALRDRSRGGDALLPRLPKLEQLQRVLPPDGLYVAPILTADELFLLAVTRRGPARIVRAAQSAAVLHDQLSNLRRCLDGQLLRYAKGWLGPADRHELDAQLDVLGAGPLGLALDDLLQSCPAKPRRLLWVPDGPLHGLPIHALRRRGRYLIEDLEIVWTFSGALLVHQAGTRNRRRGWFRSTLVVTEDAQVLPEAGREGVGVAAAFWRVHHLAGPMADRSAVSTQLRRARVAHFACHAHFDGQHPLAACVQLPSGERVHALEWLTEPVAGLPLVTLSACRSAEVSPLMGQEVFGLVTGLLGAGVRAVLAGLWPVADRETVPLMWSFYRHRLANDLATGLCLAQREALAQVDSSPLFWAVFALHGEADALPAPGLLGRWLARGRQRRHFLRCSNR